MILTGHNSMIGSRFLELVNPQVSPDALLSLPEFDLVAATEDEIVKRLFKNRGEVLIHFAAFTDVDGAQIQRGEADGICWQLNVEVTKKLTKVCQKLNLKMIYISTDFVFDGKSGPYSEDDKVAKSKDEISWYAWTKLVGEMIVQKSDTPFLIARTSYPYRANFDNKLDFVRNIIARLQEGNLYSVFTDQFLTPTFIDNFVKALNLLIGKNQIGIWHVVDNTTLSAYQAAVTIAKTFGFNPSKVKKGSLIEFQKANPTVAKRPFKGGLRNGKFTKFLANFGSDMQEFGESLIVMKRQMEAA